MTATQSQIRDALAALERIRNGGDVTGCYETIRTILQSALDTQKPAGDAVVCVEYDWKCNCCKTEFKDKKSERDENDNNGGAKCPCCKADGQYTYRVAPKVDAVESLKSVLCDPEGKCCISGSDADRKIVDDAIAALNGDCGGGDFSQAIEDIRFVRKALTKQWINKMEREFVEETHMRIHRIEEAITAPKVDVEWLKAEQRRYFNAYDQSLSNALYNHGDALIDHLAARGLIGNAQERGDE